MQDLEWQLISNFDNANKSPGFLLWKTQLLWRRQIEHALKAYDLTHTQFVILTSTAYLTRNNKHITQVELAEHTLCDINTTSQVLRALERKLLIKRLYQPGNTKCKYPVLTELGYNLLKPAIKAVEDIDSYFFERLSLDKIECLKSYFSQLSSSGRIDRDMKQT
jgi:MarR family transcriptional regulator, organic hydroperoxide resistance regulator